MPNNKPEHDPQFECMKDINLIVTARLFCREKIKVDIYKKGGIAGQPALWYMSFTPPDLNIEATKQQKVETEPGIPPDSLVPEKIGPIAYWIIRQVRAKRPE